AVFAGAAQQLASAIPTTGPAWTNLGPTTARFEWNGSSINGIDAGRVEEVRVAASNPDTVYIGTAGGGIWKTANFSASSPTWTSIGDNLPALAIGSFDISPTDQNTIIAGLGERNLDSIAVEGDVVRSPNGGARWRSPYVL